MVTSIDKEEFKFFLSIYIVCFLFAVQVEAIPLKIPVNTIPDKMISVPLHEFATIVQGPGQCEIASAFNSFYLATPKWRSVVQTLPGDGIVDKYVHFLRTFGFKPTSDYPDSKLLRNTPRGTSTGDLLTIISEFQSLHTQSKSELVSGSYIIRNQNEPIGSFSKRIRSKIELSIRNGFPLVAVVQAYKRLNSPNASPIKKLGRHAVTIVGVSESIVDSYFGIEYADPEDGEVRFAYVGESDFPIRASIRDTGEMLYRALVSMVAADPKHDREAYNSPMLVVHTPDLWDEEDDVDYTLLEFLTGNFHEKKR